VITDYYGGSTYCYLIIKYIYAYITSLGSGLGGGALMAHLVPSPQPKILYETCSGARDDYLLLHVPALRGHSSGDMEDNFFRRGGVVG